MPRDRAIATLRHEDTQSPLLKQIQRFIHFSPLCLKIARTRYSLKAVYIHIIIINTLFKYRMLLLPHPASNMMHEKLVKKTIKKISS